MLSHNAAFRLVCLFLALLLSSSSAMADGEALQCSVALGGDPRPLIENLFNETYAGRTGFAGKQAFSLLKTQLSHRVLEKCRLGCTDEELAVVTKDTLERFFGNANKVDRYSHILGGWIVLTAALVGLSDLSFNLSQHLPGQLSASVSTLVNVTAVMLLNPIMSSPASKIFRGFYRVIVFGKSFFRDDSIAQALDEQSATVRSKQTPLEAQQVGRNMQTASYAAGRAKEAADFIASMNQEIGPGRAASSLATVAILLHKYFPELNPAEANDVSMAVHELFTKWLPSDWNSREKRAQLAKMIMSSVKAHDESIQGPRDEEYYRLLINRWLELT